MNEISKIRIRIEEKRLKNNLEDGFITREQYEKYLKEYIEAVEAEQIEE